MSKKQPMHGADQGRRGLIQVPQQFETVEFAHRREKNRRREKLARAARRKNR